MTYEYFLGANSSRGFYSLYSEFCSGEGDYLHIIKGGPGTGKSGFMRRIGRAAEEKGYDVEYVLCSGDPDSLDGIYIPELHRGWVDGTAPHATEPRCFGFNSDYVNLGHFCSTPLSSANKHYVNQLYSKYKNCYSSAYDYLKACALLRKNRQSPMLRPEQLGIIRSRIKEILSSSSEKNNKHAILSPRFFHAVCCKGELYLKSSLNLLCKQHYVVSGDKALVSTVLRIAAELGSACTSKLIISPDPVEPELFDAVIMPELSLGFVSSAYGIDSAEDLIADLFSPATVYEGSSAETSIRNMALGKLRLAKALHDELEGFYKQAMDFSALDEFTEKYIKTAMD